MDDTASNIRMTPSSPPASEAGGGRVEGASSAAARAVRIYSAAPTIVTNRPPIAAPASLSDSCNRILEGRVLPGDRLGPFELLEYIGGGGMGRVFRAADPRLGRTVALKILPPEQASDPDALERFRHEAQSAARLDHDNIARVFYAGEDRGLHFIAFEYVDGVNVRRLVEEKGQLPLADVINFTIQAADALAHADARSVVHRDVKPSNMLITPEGQVKLIDMGLARVRHPDPAVADLTASGVTLGTFDYISPEQARDPRNADIRSDIYSLGCTVFFMLVGRPPFPEGTVLQKLLQHQGDQPPDVRQFRPDLPEEASRILRKMMAKDPRQRYPGAAELVSDWLVLAEKAGLRPMSATGRIWLTPEAPTVSLLQRHLPWMAPVAALAVVLLLLSWLERREDARSPLPEQIAVVSEVPPSAPAPTRPAPESPTAPTAEIPPKDSPEPPAKDSGDALPPKAPETQSPPTEFSPKSAGRVLVVGDSIEGNGFSTLGAALAAARGGDVVELRYNGRREEPRPVRIANRELTSRAGKGFRPVIVFRPNQVDPVQYPRGMFTLAAGRLTVLGASLELHVPREVLADRWSLFELFGGAGVVMERCVLPALHASARREAYHEDVAFFRPRAGPVAESADGDDEAPAAAIELSDCIARGEAAFLRAEEMQSVRLRWDNGLLAVTEPMVRASGVETVPKPDDVLRLELRHLTAAVRGGLCRMSGTPSHPYLPAVRITCAESIVIGAPGVPMIEQDAASSADDARRRFIWNGDRNWYENMDSFWTIRGIESDRPTPTMDCEAWTRYWPPLGEIQPTRAPLKWKTSPDAGRPLHDHGPADYTWDGLPAVGAPGLRAEMLPPLPPREVRATPGQAEWPLDLGARTQIKR